MNAQTAAATAASNESRHAAFAFSRSAVASWLIGALAFLLFIGVADRLMLGTWLAPQLEETWRVSEDPAAAAGQWFTAFLLMILRAIPGSGPQSLVLVTCVTGAAITALMHYRMRGRGWGFWSATLAAAAIACNPVMLIMASTGSTLLLNVILVGLVALAFDRASTVGDAQSLMGIGLSLAALVLTEPGAVYIVLPLLVLLPLGLRDVQDASSATALFLLTLFPAFIAVIGILVAAATLGEPPKFAFLRWASPMHGVESAVNAPWLAAHGGNFSEPFLILMRWYLIAMPLAVMPLVHLAMNRVEHGKPAITLMAIFCGPLAGAAATYFWHIADPIWACAVGMAFVLAWLSSRVLGALERLVCLGLLWLGAALAWSPLWMWSQPAREAWLVALTSP
jgi:hypothetical protein